MAAFLWLANLLLVSGYATLTDALAQKRSYLTGVVAFTTVALDLVLAFDLSYQLRAGVVSLLIAAAIIPCAGLQQEESRALKAMRWILLIYSAFLVVRAVSVLTPAFEAVDRVFFIYSLLHAIAVGCSAIFAGAIFRLGQEEMRRARLDLSNQMLATVADEQTNLIRLYTTLITRD